MKHYNKISLSIAALVFTTSAQAVTLDIRHEYKHHAKQHATRVKVSDSIDNFYYGLESKFASEKRDDGSQPAMGNLQRGDSEIDWGFKFKLDKNWYIQPGMPIAFGDGKYTLKPQLRIGYKASSIPLTTALRYRREYANYSEDFNDDYEQNKITFTMSYKHGKNKYWLEANYYRNEDKDIYNNTRENYDYILSAGRRMGSWFPYMELADVSSSSSSDTRQLKTRVGLKYYY
ncbi:MULTISPECIES: oligogalacturonate-specific porin KdgM family protein [Cobetia]|uniref:Oligogalacturonate-specific porin KdgM family protein n=1 Tax=Cobetia amphilecti TaxID=1055104 RepID=A0AAP4WUF9_9GAMM|nr:oligogalacturonate-specific porin KdgM family protein [Cobetia amphilecti]AVV32396.1 N-acetylneuraminic acid outer membrane channel protein NanC [Halomonas sp. SF2003]MDO6670970.1 oligogalacturonate-specific porin KdgM family protein [Cobetia amphilecti]TCJ26338.1 N-acetylneuraminic acid outer membrane channel protein NanC [Halomonas sp. GDM18]UTV86848.1 hypothetical protein KDX00_17500 [Cobetia litoralis]